MAAFVALPFALIAQTSTAEGWERAVLEGRLAAVAAAQEDRTGTLDAERAAAILLHRAGVDTGASLFCLVGPDFHAQLQRIAPGEVEGPADWLDGAERLLAAADAEPHAQSRALLQQAAARGLLIAGQPIPSFDMEAQVKRAAQRRSGLASDGPACASTEMPQYRAAVRTACRAVLSGALEAAPIDCKGAYAEIGTPGAGFWKRHDESAAVRKLTEDIQLAAESRVPAARRIIVGLAEALDRSYATSPSFTKLDVALQTFESPAQDASVNILPTSRGLNILDPSRGVLDAYVGAISALVEGLARDPDHQELAQAVFRLVARSRGAALHARSTLARQARPAGASTFAELRRMRGRMTESVFSDLGRPSEARTRMDGFGEVSQGLVEALAQEKADGNAYQQLALEAMGVYTGAGTTESARTRYRTRMGRLNRKLAAALSKTLDYGLDDVTPRSLLKGQPEGTALVVYLRSSTSDDPRYGAFVYDGRELRYRDLGSARAIEARVADLLDLIRRPTSPLARVKAVGRAVQRTVVAPLGLKLTPEKRVVLSLAGSLHRIPFDALHDGKRWLVDRVEWVRAPVLRSLSEPRDRPDRAARVVAFVDPAPASAAYVANGLDPEAYGSLAYAREELAALRSVLGDRLEPYVGEAATEARLSSLAAPDVLHVASHGVYLGLVTRAEAAGPGGDAARGSRTVQTLEDDDDEGVWLRPVDDEAGWMDNALVLAGPDKPTDGLDGFATAYELTALDFSTTRLIVLSACETGVGGASAWHGALSLQQAFLAAGAQTVVASKWQVDDEITASFMGAFYRALAQGQGVTAALKVAMRTTRSSRPHPYFWSAFDVVGDPGPVL